MKESQLLQSFGTYLRAGQITGLATALGETEHQISKALGCMGASMLVGIMEPSRSDDFFAQVETFNLELTSMDFESPGSRFLMEGEMLWAQLWGENALAFEHAVATFSGLKPVSVAALKSLAGALVLTVLKKAHPHGPVLLSAERPQIMAMLPGNIASMMGLVKVQNRKGNSFQWLYALLCLLIIGVLIAYVLKKGTVL